MHPCRPLFVALCLILSTLAGCGGSGDSTAPAKIAQDTAKSWVRAHLDDVYLWRAEIVDVAAGNYPLAPDYFDALLVKSRDRFSFSIPQAVADSMLKTGEETGFGVLWDWGAAGRLYAYYVDPRSPAAASISRGTEVSSINGTPVSIMSNASLNAALFPKQAGTTTSMTIRRPGSNQLQGVTISAATFGTTAVEPPLIVTAGSGRKVGYLLFNEHILTAEQGLVDAMTYFREQGVSEVVLDMRYNGGGYLFIAREVASMLGGVPVLGKIFEQLRFNDRHPERTNDPRNTYLFTNLDKKGTALPMLGLTRVFVITGSDTCSASESVINALLPFMQVIRIGATTCGKPYGSVQTDYDQQSYFALQFEGFNAWGQDDYKSGFAPTCRVDDDLRYPLGDTREARLSAALYYMGNNACPTAATVPLPKALTTDGSAGRADVPRLEPRRQLKIVQ